MTEGKSVILKLTIRYMIKNKRRTKAAILGICGTMMILTTVNIFANTILQMMTRQTIEEGKLNSIVNAVLVMLMLMGCVMIYNAYAISVFEKLQFLGTLGSIGASGIQKAGIIYLEGFVEGLIGVPIGMASGIFLAKISLRVIEKIFFYEDEIAVYITFGLIGKIALLGFFMIFLACLFPAWKAARTSSIDLITHQVVLESKVLEVTNLLEGTWKLGVNGTLALRNIWVRRKNYLVNGVLLILTFCLILDGIAVMRGVNGDYAPKDEREREKLELWVELYTNDMERITMFYEKVSELPEVKKISLERNLDLEGMLLKKEQLQEDLDDFGIRDYVGFFESQSTIVDVKNAREVEGYWVCPYIIGLDEQTFEEYVEKAGYEMPANKKYPVLLEDYVTICQNGEEKRRSILKLKPGTDFSFSYSRYGDLMTLAMYEELGKNKFDEILEGEFYLIGTTKEVPPFPYYSGTIEEIDGFQDITLGVIRIYMPMDSFYELINDPNYVDTYGKHPEETAAFNYNEYKSIFTYLKFDVEREEVHSNGNLLDRIFRNRELEQKIEEDKKIEKKIQEIAGEIGLQEEDAEEVDLLTQGGKAIAENDTYYFGSRSIVQREKYFRSEKYLLLILGYGMIGLITVLALTNIFQNISTSMRIRKREFAMFQSMGISAGSLRKMLLVENAMYGMIGVTLGIPISFMLLTEVEKEFSKWNEINWKIPWDMVPVQIVIAVLLIVLPMIHTILQMKQLNLIDAIRSENV